MLARPAFRVSTLILLAVTVAGIAVSAALLGHPQRFTVAVTAQAPPAVAVAVRADGKATGLQVKVVTTADRAAAVRSIEQGSVTAAVAAGGRIIWKAQPNTSAERGGPAGHHHPAHGKPGPARRRHRRLLAPVRVPVTQLHSQSQRTARTIIGYISALLLYMAIAVTGLRADRGRRGEVEPSGGGAAVPRAAVIPAGRQDCRDRAGRARPVPHRGRCGRCS